MPKTKLATDPEYTETRQMLRRIGIVDLHVDSIIQQRLFGYDVLKRHDPGRWGQPLIWHADIPRMLEAGYRGAVMGIHYFPTESEKGWDEIRRQIDYLDEIAEREPRCLRVREPADWYRALVQDKIALAPGVEGLHTINGKLERLEELARRDVKVLTLAHFSHNACCSASVTVLQKPAKTGQAGLTRLGRDAVRELNRLGIAIDVAHVHREGVLETCELTRAPVFCTHTGLVSMRDHPRNITDEEIDAIAATGGGIGPMYGPIFLTGSRTSPDSAPIANAIDAIAGRVGIKHVVTGTDYDGWMPGIPSDQRDCRDMVKVAHRLRGREYREDALNSILGENARRIFTQVWKARG